MSAERRWRVGIVGSGFGANVHLPAFRAQGSFDVVGLASPNRAAQIGRERNVAATFGSLEEMLDSVDVDVVSIATPPRDHLRLVLLALERGKNVLCEKPFARTVAEAEEMLAALDRAGTVGAIAHEFRYTSSRLAMHELIANKHMGPLREIEYTLLYTFLRADAERRNNWWFKREHGGGLAGAILSHEVDTVNWLAGRPPVRVTGLSRTANVERTHEGKRFVSDVDDGAFALIDYGDGLIGRVTVDGTRAVESATLAVHGERRTGVIAGEGLLGGTMYVVDGDETSELTLKPEPYASLASVRFDVPAFVALLDRYAKALRGESADLPTFAQGVETQRVLAAVGYGVE